MTPHRTRIAGMLDLPAINEVISLALASWDTTDRVKRLALPVYHYRPDDLDHMWLLAAEDPGGILLGIAALEEADEAELPVPGRALLLHGIYVRPAAMGEGIGGSLLTASTGIARELCYEGLLVKSVRHSRGFFERYGLDALPAVRESDYPFRYWTSTSFSSDHATRLRPARALGSIADARC